MIVILEGPNKCGKTTLAKHLIEKHGFAYFKDTRIESRILTNEQKKEVIEHDIEAQANLIMAISNSINLIIDRFHITEYVYGKLFRNYESNCINIAENMLINSNVKLVYCHRIDDTDSLVKLYDETIKESKLELLSFDILKDDVKELNKFLNLRYSSNIEMQEGKCII